MTAPTIGIDLGTTFSCASVYRNGRPEIIPNPDGDHLTPSIVYFDPKTGEVSVGRIADQLSLQCPSNCLLDSKRFIGRQYDDDFISQYIKSKQKQFFLVRGDDDRAAFQIKICNKKVLKKPEEVSAEVLKYLRDAANVYLGETVTSAVISVPAYFSNAQRKTTKEAATLAGLNVLKLVTEPTAATIHYVADKQRIDSYILTVDFGGGTLDVSLIKVKDKILEVKAVYGDPLLGGRDFDKLLFDYLFGDLDFGSRNENVLPGKFKHKLREECVSLKKNLSTKQEFPYTGYRYDGDSGDDLSLTRKKFEDISKDFFKRVMRVMELCLVESGISKSEIKEVVLVGGSTRIPKIKELLTSYFGTEKIKTDLNPDEAVAAGASIYAAYLLEDHPYFEKYKVTEVTPMSLGIKSYGQLMNFFIPRNTPLPAKASDIYQTVFNDQEHLTFTIYEGERKNTAYNNVLGEFTISDLPKKRAGDVKCSVHVSLDEDGILTVKATEKSTGKNNKLVVTMGEFRLSERRIKSSIKDAKEHKIEDEVFEKFRNFKSSVLRQCQLVLYDLNKITSKNDQQFVRRQSENLLAKLDDLDFTEIEKLDAMFVVYNNSVSDILQNNSMLQLEDIWCAETSELPRQASRRNRRRGRGLKKPQIEKYY